MHIEPKWKIKPRHREKGSPIPCADLPGKRSYCVCSDPVQLLLSWEAQADLFVIIEKPTPLSGKFIHQIVTQTNELYDKAGVRCLTVVQLIEDIFAIEPSSPTAFKSVKPDSHCYAKGEYGPDCEKICECVSEVVVTATLVKVKVNGSPTSTVLNGAVSKITSKVAKDRNGKEVAREEHGSLAQPERPNDPKYEVDPVNKCSTTWRFKPIVYHCRSADLLDVTNGVPPRRPGVSVGVTGGSWPAMEQPVIEWDSEQEGIWEGTDEHGNPVKRGGMGVIKIASVSLARDGGRVMRTPAGGHVVGLSQYVVELTSFLAQDRLVVGRGIVTVHPAASIHDVESERSSAIEPSE